MLDCLTASVLHYLGLGLGAWGSGLGAWGSVIGAMESAGGFEDRGSGAWDSWARVFGVMGSGL